MDHAKNKSFGWLYPVLLTVFLFVYLLGKDPIFDNDSFSFISFSSDRPPLYPFFLWVFHAFGKYQFYIVKWTQAALCLATLLYAGNWLQKKLAMPPILTFFILFFTILEVFVGYKLLQSIYSEGIAFPIFIICFLLLIECLEDFSLKKIIFLTISIGLLILARMQFYYFYLLYPLMIFWFLGKKIPLKKTSFAAIIMILSIFLTAGISRSYHYWINGEFAESSATGIQLIIPPVFFADSSSLELLKKPEEKIFLKNLLTQVEQQQINIRSAPLSFRNLLDHTGIYYFYYITHDPIALTIRADLKDKSPFEQNKILVSISKQLYSHNLTKLLVFYFWETTNYIGNFPLFISLLFIVGFVILRFMFDKKWQPNLAQVFVLTSLLIILINASFVAAFIYGSVRYFYYMHFIIFCLSGLLIQKFFWQDKWAS